jgi:hypothetical protein
MPSLYDVRLDRLEFIWRADPYAVGRHRWPALTWDDTSMSTMTCDDNLLGSRPGQKPSTATSPSPVRNEPQHAGGTSFLRPGPEDLSEAIPVFFIGRNKDGHWVARGADGKSGGLFWRKQAAIRFATQSAWPARCATIFPSENIELDLENQGNPLLALTGVMRTLRSAGAAISVLLVMAALAGVVVLKAAIFLSRLNY